MRATCPDCGAQAHLASFFVEDEGKRLAATFAAMQPDLARSVLGYLSLFKPAKTALRLGRAAKIAQEVADLVAAGSVCRDERSGVRRKAAASHWAAGIDQMLAQRASLTLPLESHGYLKAVVYGLADKADAAAERQREDDAKAGRHLGRTAVVNAGSGESKLQTQLAWIDQRFNLDQITKEEATAERAAAFAKYGDK